MKRLSLVTLLCLVPFLSALAIGPGHSGSWYWDDQSGHGFSIEIGELPDGSPLGVVYWYNFDNQGNPIFMVGTGIPDGDMLDVLFESPVGMIFGEFDPLSVIREDGGSGRFVFTDENIATFQYTPSGFTVANWGHSPIAFMPLIKLFGIPVNEAGEDIAALEARVAELETLVAGVRAELERVSPDSDLTGSTYCFFSQGNNLQTFNGGAEIGADPSSSRVDFTSATQLTATTRYDHSAGVSGPPWTSYDIAYPPVSEPGTYTVAGNRLTITIGGEVTSLYMTPDARVVVGGSFERSVIDGRDLFHAGLLVGVRTASCD